MIDPAGGSRDDAESRDIIVFVSMSRGIGGPARSLLSVLAHLSDDVQRVLFAPPGNLVQLARGAGSIEQYLPMPYRLRFRQLSRLRAAVALAGFVRRHRQRILAIHANGQTEPNLCALSTLLSGVPVVMWAHASKANPSAGLLRSLWRRRRGRVRWLAVSETARETLAHTVGIDPADISIVTNPIDPADVVGPRTAHDRVQIGYLGLASPAKGWHLLPEIVRTVGPDGVGWQIFTAKPAPHAPPEVRGPWDELEGLSEDFAIALRGRTLNVRRAYASCDIVLCPSSNESFGRIAAEAMMNGLPVVGSDIPAFRELVAERGGGVLFPTGDAIAAGTALRTLVDDPDLRQVMGQRGREHVARYSPRRLVPLLEAAYRQAGAERNRI